MKEKKKNMHFGSLIKSFELIFDITKEVHSLIGLTTCIVYNLFGLGELYLLSMWMKFEKLEE